MFEIVNDDDKEIVISLHLEEIYNCMCNKMHINNREQLYKNDQISGTCIDNLENQVKIKNEYQYIIDFMNINSVQANYKAKLFDWIKQLPQITVANTGKLKQEIKEINITIDDSKDYRSAFDKYARKYIQQKCLDTSGYTTQIGIQLDVYVNFKIIINDSFEMLRWCYIVAYDLKRYFSSIDDNKKNILFCHTMNGACIAGLLSQLLGYELVYVDHLGPYNKLNKFGFYKGKSVLEEYIIISDMVCLGNEFLRAKNIVEYLGGTVRGCAGFLELNISDLLDQYSVNCFALKYEAEEAKNQLKYNIKTKLNS